MLKQIFETLRGVLFLTRDAEELRTELTHLSEEVRGIQFELNDLAHKFESLSERERLEREKLVLAMENALLRVERRLPPARTENEK